MTIGRFNHPVRGLLHGSAAVGAGIGSIGLVAAVPNSPGVRAAVAVYAVGLVTMFTTSSLYHSIPWTPFWKDRMRRLDHAAIFLMIAGTVTPMAVIALDGWERVTVVSLLWLGAVGGVVHKLKEERIRLGPSIALQNLLGWTAVIPIWHAADRLDADALRLLVLGGLMYTAGMVSFLTKRPRLLPHLFSSHELFHLMVVVAAGLHYYVIRVGFLSMA